MKRMLLLTSLLVFINENQLKCYYTMFDYSQSSLGCVTWFFSVEIPWRRRDDKRDDPIFTCGGESFHI